LEYLGEDLDLKRAFVTGASGFVGSYLMDHLLLSGWDVAGHDQRAPSRSNIAFYEGDILRGDGLVRALRDFQPEAIFHLAGLLKSEKPVTFYNVHVLGTVTLFESIAETGLHPRVVVASSSAVYGAGFGKRPITESFRPRPATHYAVSKLAQEMVAMRYFRSIGLPVMCVRTFNLLGPGLSPDMAPSAFARQIARAERIGKPATISTGDLSAQRDYVDVRDAVRAYSLIAERGSPGAIYNVCSGRAISIRAGLRILLDQAEVPIEAVLDPARVQKNDIPIQIGSAKKLHESTGWKAKISVMQSLIDLLNDWREKVKSERRNELEG
jgi:GDP-4-dehydro-6-deoxy-D-mannose reductase